MDLDYFHGNISRLESESLLKPSFGTGTFLVRTSQQFPGDYVLSLLHAPTRGKPEYMHFQIKSQGECWFSVDDGPLFEGIDACITHYRFIPDGLPCVLFSSISRPRIRTREQENVGNTPMHTAAAQGKVEALRSNPSDVRKASKINRLPIHEACRFGHDKFVDGLLLLKSSYAFDINMPDEDGWTPMHFAAFSGNPSILRRLMASGGKLGGKTKDGETPRDIAARLGNTDACKMLGDAEQGVVAEADIDRESLPYMHGRVGRKVAEYILRKNLMKDGNFIVRQSQGDYVLSLSFNNQFFHFQIKPNNAARTCFSIDDGPTFQGIPRVLDYYRTKADGLPCVLTTYCVRGGYSKGGKTFAAAGVAASANDIAPAVDKLQLKFDTGIYATYAAPMDRSAAMAKGSAGGAAAINREDVVLGDKIGEGEFGAVYKGEWREPRGPKHQVAVKTLHPNAELENPDSQLCQDFLREAEVMSQLQHPNVVRLLGVVRYTQPLMIVQELVPLGSLQDYLESNKGKLGKKTMTLFGYQIALGMSFLEEKKFVHRDLASRNILVATPALVKISDFGFSRAIGSDDNYYKASQGGKWPMKWYAPECLYYFRFSHKSDVWSFGVTLWEIFTYAEMPYGDQSGREVLDQLTQGIRLPQPDDCPKDVYKVMLSCWEFEQEKRPDFKTLKDQLQKLC